MSRQPFSYGSRNCASDEEGHARSQRAAGMSLRKFRLLAARRSPLLEAALPELIVICAASIQAPVHVGRLGKLSPGRPRASSERYPEHDADNRDAHAVQIDVLAEQLADEIARPFDDDFGDDIKKHVPDKAEHAAYDFAGDFSKGHGQRSAGDDITVRYRGLSPMTKK